jgi:ribosomal protein S18 acetylase RimI-like enzyme
MSQAADAGPALVPDGAGVDPPHRRRGYGRALIRSGIQRTTCDNKPIYLEAETDANAAFGNKFGFEVLGEITTEAIYLPFLLMIHQPETAHA